MAIIEAKYEGEKVKITCRNGKVYTGYVCAVIYEDESDLITERELDLDHAEGPDDVNSFAENDIESIEVIG